jgi:pimeloyl-[acyl-carrier protein] methyl ester esterase
MGATVLWNMLSRGKRGEIAGLVTIDMTPRVLNDVAWRLGLADGFDALDCAQTMMRMQGDWKQYSARVAANALAGEKPAPALLRLFETSFADNDAELMAAAWESLCNADLRDALPAIDTPMLVTHGMRSKLYTPAVSAFVADTAPNAARAPFYRSGHAPHLEEPERFNRLLNDFAAILSGQDVRRDIRRLGENAVAHHA